MRENNKNVVCHRCGKTGMDNNQWFIDDITGEVYCSTCFDKKKQKIKENNLKKDVPLPFLLITSFLVIIVVFFIFQSGWINQAGIVFNDRDGDGIVDDEDFFDSGDGAIKISITSCTIENAADEFYLTTLDPYFVMKLYVDGRLVESKTSRTYENTLQISNPLSITYNADDDLDKIKLYIYAFDEDEFTSDDVIDICSSSNTYYSNTFYLKSIYPNTISTKGEGGIISFKIEKIHA